MLTITPIPAFNDNYIWMFHQSGSSDVFVVDPGDAQPVEQALKEQQCHLAGILITHHHYDHTGGITALTADRDIPVYGPDNTNISGITHPLKDGSVVMIAGTQFTVFATPGHTLDHIAYFTASGEQGNPALFCGDTLFSAGCGRLFEGTAEQMYSSLSTLAALPQNTLIYPAHEYTQANLEFALAVEPNNKNIIKRKFEVEMLRQRLEPSLPSSLATELATNPFLRSGQTSVINAALQKGAQPGASASHVLRVIREWKDQF
ncbi:hydroxyacylglutathione hydrolase [uncultured Endozoicomonas sp.]|uniref:hydroxyacylglutathione hydrolase n=1 Tax=uncultured Endozoicomonas sp. TaxID=432652 RepID=UPI0026168D1E|nr:hydroxyacylglutathione hydrolase [uncultured Endozoicomonas sp.]